MTLARAQDTNVIIDVIDNRIERGAPSLVGSKERASCSYGQLAGSSEVTTERAL